MTDVDRRHFLDVFAATGLATTLLPGILWAQIQPGTRTITVEMIRNSAALAGLIVSDEEAQNLAASLSSLSKHAEQIDKPTLTNASPLPLHFDPRPPAMEFAAPPPAMFRVDPGTPLSKRWPSGR
jgi:Asp-tRNA(Asn)/Glu-tRNA(Gln) amidotransferase C subunit